MKKLREHDKGAQFKEVFVLFSSYIILRLKDRI